MKKPARSIGQPLLTVLLVSIFPAVFLYCRNAEEADFPEIIPALLLFAAAGVVLFALASLLTKGACEVSALIATVMVLILTNFSLIEAGLTRFISGLKYWHTVPLMIVLGLHAAYLIRRFVSGEMARDLVKIVCLVFSLLIAFNVVTGAPHIINRLSSKQQLNQISYSDDAEINVDLPNIYLFLFDEYANFPQMEAFYDYDNAPLRDFLAAHHFTVSYSGRNESILTDTITTNLVNLEYIVNDKTPGSELEMLRKQGALYALLSGKGYALRGAEVHDQFGLPSMLGSVSGSAASTVDGETLYDLAIKQTILYPLWQRNTAEAISKIMQVVDGVSGRDAIPEGGTFTLVYLCFPHHPFLVDENGAAVPASQAINWEDQRYYLGQFKYATQIMLKMLSNVVENDPDSVIFLQSDHGARAYGIPNVTFPLEVMANPLNAVYYQGEEMPGIEGLSTVNTIRLVLNRLFGMDLEMLDVPQAAQ